MATKTTPVELTIVEQIEQAAEEIKRRKREVKDLDAEAEQLAASDPDHSIELDMKARSTERLIARLMLTFQALVKARHQEQYAGHVVLIEAVVAKKSAEAQELAKRLAAACVEVNRAALVLADIGFHREHVPGLCGKDLLKWNPTKEGHPYADDIRQAVNLRISALGRASFDLRNHLRNPSFFPKGNILSTMTFTELRSEVPDLSVRLVHHRGARAGARSRRVRTLKGGRK